MSQVAPVGVRGESGAEISERILQSTFQSRSINFFTFKTNSVGNFTLKLSFYSKIRILLMDLLWFFASIANN
jgi:hypothetical protein